MKEATTRDDLIKAREYMLLVIDLLMGGRYGRRTA